MKELTSGMIEREATGIAYKMGLINYMSTKLITMHIDIGALHDLLLSFTINKITVSTHLDKSDLFMSLDDFSERIIHPLIVNLTRQDRDLMFLHLECS